MCGCCIGKQISSRLGVVFNFDDNMHKDAGPGGIKSVQWLDMTMQMDKSDEITVKPAGQQSKGQRV